MRWIGLHERRIGDRLALGLVVLLSAAGVARGQDAPGREDPGLVATTSHFAFHSDFATNLNDALIAAGTARKRKAAELFHDGGAEEDCLAELPPSARAGWNLAVDWYAEIVASSSWMGRQQYVIRMHLAGLEEAPPDERTRSFLDVAEGFRLAAAPAYRACRWPAQDAENRRWIEYVTGRIAAHGAAIAPRLEEVYGRPWPVLPIRVDLVPAALPVGANTFSTPPHVQIASTTTDQDALEIVFHEASHTIGARNDPMQQALARAAEKLGTEIPRDLWHVVLFYTTGQVVRAALEAGGEPGYVPYVDAHDLWAGRWGRFREAVEATWPAYLAGKRSLEAAAVDLLRALKEEPADDGPAN
jgi:hypothetical protein